MSPRKNRKNASHAAPSVVNASVAASLDTASPLPVNAAPVRHSIGAPSSLRPASPNDAFSYRGAHLNGTPNPHRNDACTLSPVALTPSDVPALLSLAASLLSAAGATFDASLNIIPTPSLSRAVGPAVRDYLSNRATATAPAGYFAPNRMYDTDGNAANPTDTLYYATRAAERIVYSCDRIANRTARRAFSGGFGSALRAADRRDSVALTVASLLTPAAP